MALTDELAAGPETAPKLNRIEKWLLTLTETERAAALEMMADRRWSGQKIAAAFGRNGLTTTAPTVQAYRTKMHDTR